MTRILMNRWFQRFSDKERIGTAALIEAIERADRGLIDADLGGGVIKQRVTRPGDASRVFQRRFDSSHATISRSCLAA